MLGRFTVAMVAVASLAFNTYYHLTTATSLTKLLLVKPFVIIIDTAEMTVVLTPIVLAIIFAYFFITRNHNPIHRVAWENTPDPIEK